MSVSDPISRDRDDEESSEAATLTANLRSRLEDLLPQNEHLALPFHLLHWLRGHRMDVDSTESAIRKSIKWRQESGMITVAEPKAETETEANYPEDYSTFFTFEHHLRSKSGRFLVLWPLGSWDVKAFTDKYGSEAFVRFICQCTMKREQKLIQHNLSLQNLKNESSDKDVEFNDQQESESEPNSKSKSSPGDVIIGEKGTGLTLVISGSGYCIKQARSLQTIKTAIEIAKIINTNFPQNIDALYFINVNKVFLMIMKMLQPFINVPYFEVIENEEKWRSVLHQLVDHDVDLLPPEFGGNQPEPPEPLEPEPEVIEPKPAQTSQHEEEEEQQQQQQ